jgi:hypothetical protein
MKAHRSPRILSSLVFLVISISAQWPTHAHAISRELITSATYGVLAGTIVGAATLAFTENPGDNLNRIARGASLGLYAGLVLGFYVTYGVSTAPEYYEDEVRAPETLKLPKLAVFPLADEKGLHGAAASWNVYNF